MRKNAAFMILAAGIIVALLVGLFTFGWLQKKTRLQARTVTTESVMVAAIDLPWGTVIKGEQVKSAPYLKASLPPGYFPDSKALTGRTLLYPVKQNEPIFESRLAPTSVKGGGVSALISASKRAMAVKVDKVIGVSGYVNPGNRVDVLVTFSENLTKSDSPVTKTVLENILVLAVGSEMEKSGKQEKPTPVDVITLELTPEEGERLALAATEGKVQLALRSSTDNEGVVTKGATVRTLLGGSGNAQVPVRKAMRARSDTPTIKPVKAVEAPKAVQSVYNVQAIRGTTVNEYKFEKGE